MLANCSGVLLRLESLAPINVELECFFFSAFVLRRFVEFNLDTCRIMITMLDVSHCHCLSSRCSSFGV